MDAVAHLCRPIYAYGCLMCTLPPYDPDGWEEDDSDYNVALAAASAAATLASLTTPTASLSSSSTSSTSTSHHSSSLFALLPSGTARICGTVLLTPTSACRHFRKHDKIAVTSTICSAAFRELAETAQLVGIFKFPPLPMPQAGVAAAPVPVLPITRGFQCSQHCGYASTSVRLIAAHHRDKHSLYADVQPESCFVQRYGKYVRLVVSCTPEQFAAAHVPDVLPFDAAAAVRRHRNRVAKLIKQTAADYEDSATSDTASDHGEYDFNHPPPAAAASDATAQHPRKPATFLSSVVQPRTTREHQALHNSSAHSYEQQKHDTTPKSSTSTGKKLHTRDQNNTDSASPTHPRKRRALDHDSSEGGASATRSSSSLAATSVATSSSLASTSVAAAAPATAKKRTVAPVVGTDPTQRRRKQIGSLLSQQRALSTGDDAPSSSASSVDSNPISSSASPGVRSTTRPRYFGINRSSLASNTGSSVATPRRSINSTTASTVAKTSLARVRALHRFTRSSLPSSGSTASDAATTLSSDTVSSSIASSSSDAVSTSIASSSCAAVSTSIASSSSAAVSSSSGAALSLSRSLQRFVPHYQGSTDVSDILHKPANDPYTEHLSKLAAYFYPVPRLGGFVCVQRARARASADAEGDSEGLCCYFAQSKASVSRHLRYTHQYMLPNINASMVELFDRLLAYARITGCEIVHFEPQVYEQQPVPIIPIVAGVRCPFVTSCSYCSVNAESIQTHLLRVHSVILPDADNDSSAAEMLRKRVSFSDDNDTANSDTAAVNNFDTNQHQSMSSSPSKSSSRSISVSSISSSSSASATDALTSSGSVSTPADEHRPVPCFVQVVNSCRTVVVHNPWVSTSAPARASTSSSSTAAVPQSVTSALEAPLFEFFSAQPGSTAADDNEAVQPETFHGLSSLSALSPSGPKPLPPHRSPRFVTPSSVQSSLGERTVPDADDSAAEPASLLTASAELASGVPPRAADVVAALRRPLVNSRPPYHFPRDAVNRRASVPASAASLGASVSSLDELQDLFAGRSGYCHPQLRPILSATGDTLCGAELLSQLHIANMRVNGAHLSGCVLRGCMIYGSAAAAHAYPPAPPPLERFKRR